jgi:hypothetical protein
MFGSVDLLREAGEIFVFARLNYLNRNGCPAFDLKAVVGFSNDQLKSAEWCS